jgi:uncharacterized repeat protein (TIGR03803 family)
MKPRVSPVSSCRFVSALVLVLSCASLAAAATETMLHQFDTYDRGAFPATSLVADSQGNYYGTTSSGGTYGFGTVFKLTTNSSGKWNQTVIYNFTGLADGNNSPYQSGNLVFDKSGNLYGTTSLGGASSCYCGVVFELSPGADGAWKETVLHSFTGGTTDGAFPDGGLVFDGTGNLYGTTLYGGPTSPRGACPDSSCGTVFELVRATSGWREGIVHFFSGIHEGANPTTGMIVDAKGNLYGTTSTNNVASTVFELSRASGIWSLTTLYTFSASGDPSDPNGLVFDAQGNLYASSYLGGVNNDGTVFELSPASPGWTEKTLYTFTGAADGYTPYGNLIFDGSGNLYGVTYGSKGGYGVVYRLTPSGGGWTDSVLYTFTGGSDGAAPQGGLVLDSAGDLFGTTSEGSTANIGTVFELVLASGTYTENQIFAFPGTDGVDLQSGLVADTAGNLYGTATEGGFNQCPLAGNAGCGSVFELSRSSNGTWQRTVLHNFTGTQNGDGGLPNGTLIFDSAGNLYGTTSNSIYGGGTIFKLSPSASGRNYQIIYKFGSHHGDGEDPFSGLLIDAAGNLYGTTIAGGNGSYLNCSYCGTVYKLAPTTGGHYFETVIYNFQGEGDGSYPLAGLTIDQAGNLYGTTSQGGINDGDQGFGVVFKLAPNSNGSWTQSVLYAFTGANDGGVPYGGVIFDNAGNLYGTAATGGDGCGYGCGVVFELTPTSSGPWTETVIHPFAGTPDGASPQATLTFDTAGNLYGTTFTGGAVTDNPYCLGGGGSGCGTVFKLTPSTGGWTESILYNFGGPLTDGANPASSVILDSTGNIYGTTSGGGINGYSYQRGGTAFKLTP